MCDIEKIRDALDFISPSLPYTEWINVLIAIKSELDNDLGYSIAKEWSEGGDTYKEHAFNNTWKTIRPRTITIKTLFWMAIQEGWKPGQHEAGHMARPVNTSRKNEWEAKQINESPKKQYAIDKVLSECTNIEGTTGMDYLENRLGIRPPSPNLLFHPNLKYYDSNNGRQQGSYPAIIAKIISADNDLVTLHRTYLSDAQKAPVHSPRKIMTPPWPKTITGAAIHLYKHTETLILAEGIETVLALSVALKEPAWACHSANGVGSVIVPEEVKTVIIGGDNDENGTGQKAAYLLASRLKKEGKQVRLMIPDKPGDWLDVLRAA